MNASQSSNGRQLSLGPKLAEGGEGRIHVLNGAGDHLVKVYHKPVDDLMHRKLIAMVQLRTRAIEAVAAWPSDIAYASPGRCIGFVMPRITGPGIIDKLSHPAEQRIAFPKIEYGFLVHVSLNLMRAASTLHAAGCVIGDVNESNVYVLADGTVRFIDVDSFQIQHQGHLYPCNVGTPIFTPPELQGATFRGVTRTPAHDTFGLAVLVFQLLMQGCHPFAGVPRDGRGRTIEEAIREGLYAYSAHRRDRISPPPDRMSPSALGELAELFDRSFLNPNRPTTAEWMNALERTRGRLRRCAKNSRHSFVHDAGTCALCRLARDPFPQYGSGQPQQVDLGGLSIGELIRQASQLPALRLLGDRCGEPDVLGYERIVPTAPRNVPEAKYSPLPAKRDSGVGTVGGCSLVAGFLLMSAMPALGIGAIALGFVLLIVANALAQADAKRRAEVIAQSAAELKARQQAVLDAYEPIRRNAFAALDKLGATELRAKSLEHSATGAIQPLAKAAAEAREWLSLADRRLHTDLRSANDSYRQHRLAEHLERHLIAHAPIEGIGPSRKAILASFGIETAADVDRKAIQRISGFGPRLTDRLLAWRRKCEQTFNPRGDLKAPPDWLQKIQQQHLSAVATQAMRLRGVITEFRGVYASYDKQLSEVAIELDRARRDCRAALRLAKSA